VRGESLARRVAWGYDIGDRPGVSSVVANKHPREKGAIMSTDGRMEKMEGQLARIRWVNRCLIGCIVVSLGVWFISMAFDRRTVWAKQFIVEDGNGKVLAALGMRKDKAGPELVLLDENGKVRAVLVVDKDGPRVTLLGADGKVIWSAP